MQRSLMAASAGAALPWYRAGGAPMPVAAYQPIGAASLAASYTNLANPGTYDAAPGVAPTFSAVTGWVFNGVDQYLTTGLMASTSLPTAIVRFTTTSTATIAPMLGGAISAGLYYLAPRHFGGRLFGYGGNYYFLASTAGAGVMAFAANIAYFDGSFVGNINSGSIASVPIFLGAYVNSGLSPTAYGQVNIQAVAIYSSTLTASQVAAVSAAMAALT